MSKKISDILSSPASGSDDKEESSYLQSESYKGKTSKIKSPTQAKNKTTSNNRGAPPQLLSKKR